MALPYDPASQVTQILHQLTATSTPINQAGYAYNPVGNRTSLTDRRGSQAFGYDTLDRLTSASHPLLATPQTFAYDPVGNRTTGGSVVNAGNQLTADATQSYQYDDNGNLTRKTLLATGNYTQYTYDAENRLTKVEDFVAGNPTAAFTSTYRYDGLGRRIEKVANGQTKRYIYDGEDILLEYDGTNTLQARYTHGPGIDEPIAVAKAGSTFLLSCRWTRDCDRLNRLFWRYGQELQLRCVWKHRGADGHLRAAVYLHGERIRQRKRAVLLPGAEL